MGFGDVNNYARGFGAVLYRERAEQEEKKPYPTLGAASTNINLERRYEAAHGEPPPEPPKKENLLTKALDILDRPGQAVRSGISALQKGKGFGAALERAKEGFLGRDDTSGQDLLQYAAQTGNPLAQKLMSSKTGRFIAGVGTEILTDPVSYITVGTARAAKGFGALVPSIQREVFKETGKKIARESAERLARNAVKGQVPIGRLGTAVSRALGYTAETRRIKTGFGKVAQAGQKVIAQREAKGFKALADKYLQQAKQLREEAKAAKAKYTDPLRAKQKAQQLRAKAKNYRELAEQQKKKASELIKKARKFKTPTTTARVMSVAGKPGFDKSTLRFMGAPVADVTPIRTVLGAAVEKLPGATRVRDTLGRMFKFNYTPVAIKGIERVATKAAKERITQAVREIPYLREKAMEGVAKRWKDTAKEAAELAPDVIEETIEGGPEARKAAQKASQMFDEDAARFAAEGIPLNVIDNYVQHLYHDPPEKVKRVLDRWRAMSASKQVQGAKPSFTKRRTIPTLEEARKLGLHPVQDVRVLTMVHRAMTEQAVALQRMGKDLVRMGDDVVSNVPKVAADGRAYVQAGDTQIPALKGKYLHPEVAQALSNLMPVITNSDEGINIALKGLDYLTRSWKALVTGARPMFHVRNFMGNVFLNMADGLFNPLRYPQAAAVLTGALPYVELAGKRVPTRVVREWFAKEALRGMGMFAEAAGPQKLTDEAARTLAFLERGLGAKVPYYFRHPLTWSRKVGEASDSLTRMANFLHHLDRGLSPAEAARKTRIALFDYGALTPLEQKLRRWYIPFWAWTRNALPRMLERLVGAPGLFTGAAHVRQGFVDVNEIDEQNLPEWLRDIQAIPLWVDGKGQIHYMTLNLPITELARIHEPTDVRENARELALMANPIFTTLVQIAQNKMLFIDKEITKFEDVGGPEMWKDYAGFALGQMGPAREIATQLRGKEMQRQYERDLAQGKAVELPPKERTWFEKLGMGTVQRPEDWARQEAYARREYLQQLKEADEAQGIYWPEAKELPELTERKGFGAVSRGSYGGRGFGAVGNPIVKAAKEPPTVVKQAMEIAGVSPDWGPYLRLLMDAESGGNPMAQNPLWVNYKTGETSRTYRGSGWYRASGLFQLMPPTFEAYKVPGYDDIWNPLHNTIAAIRYIKARYGHPANIPGLGQEGYRGY